MASLDAGAIASIGDSVDVPGSVSKGFQLKDLIDTTQLNQLKLAGAKRQDAQDQEVAKIFKTADISTPKGAAEAAGKVARVDPAKGMDLLKFSQQAATGQLEQQTRQLELYSAAHDYQTQQVGQIVSAAGAVNDKGVPRYDTATRNAMTVAAIAKETADIKDDTNMDPALKQTLLQSLGRFTNQKGPNGQPIPITFDRLRDVYQQMPQGQKQIQAALDAVKTRGEIANQGIQGEHLSEEKRHNRAEEDIQKGKQQQQQMTQAEHDAEVDAIGKYQQAPPSSRSAGAYKLMGDVMEKYPNYDANTFTSRQKAYKDFATGKQGQAVKSFNVALSHLDTLQNLADALENGDIRLVNKASQAWAEQTGGEAPADFNAAKHIVGDEIVKAVVGAGGGVADRENAAKTVDQANSPAQLKGVINTYKSLMKGQLQGLKKQYEATTGRDDFDRFLTEEAQAVSETPKETAPAKGGAPTVGTVQDGYRYKGGDPSKKESWEKVGG